MVVPNVPSTELFTVIVLFASAVPVNVGVVSAVMLSVLELPVSLPAARSGVPGTETEVSMVMDNPEDVELVLPATSVAVAVIVCEPAASVDEGV